MDYHLLGQTKLKKLNLPTRVTEAKLKEKIMRLDRRQLKSQTFTKT